ncbi:MAG: hypothetical protein HRT38_11310 [Alteromonadaceae bacterium]|nr:hypothetical protein [Alteromonadaceae bacterium]
MIITSRPCHTFRNSILLLTLLPVLLIDKNDQADPVEVIFNNFIDVSVKTEQQTKLIYLGW